jgi:hypothetical protein
MRWLVLLALLNGCVLLDHKPGPIKKMIDAGSGSGSAKCPEPAPPGDCVCTDTIGWACTTCPFGEGSDPVACTDIGSGCQIETWEHGCDCGCVAPGWWACSPETIGSTCPRPPPPDAGVD